jgi:hypothetical protein
MLWLLLPTPQLPSDPTMEPETRDAAVRALRASQAQQLRFTHRQISRVEEQLKQLPGEFVFMVCLYITCLRTCLGLFVSVDAIQECEQPRKQDRVMIVTGISPRECKAESGDHITLLSVKNKQDYARLHGYEFYLSAHQSDPQLKGAWNKVALVRDLLQQNPDVEWVVWMDYDALIIDMEFQLPLNRYIGRDFVLWGQAEELFEVGDAHMGLNTGVFLIRNSEWSIAMLNETSRYGVDDGKALEDVLTVA